MLRTLPRTVWLLGGISLLNDAASELVYPLIPLYLTTVLAAGPRALGLIEGAAEAASSLLKLVSGAWYDRVGHAKPFVISGYSMAALARPLIAFVTVWPILLALRLLDRIGKGLRTSPRDALLALSVAPGERGLAFGLHRAADNAGAVIGPLLAAALLAAGVPIRDILLGAALPGLLCVLLGFWLKEPETKRVDPVTEPRTRRDWDWQGLPASFRRYLIVVALFALGNSSNAFLLLRAADVGLAPAEVALWWAICSAAATLGAVPLSRLSDRLGRLRLITAGWLIYAAIYCVMGVTSSDTVFWGLAVAFGVYLAATEGAERALVADIVPGRRLGSAYGWFHLVNGLMLFPASFIFGALWQGASVFVAFAFGAGCALAALILLRAWVDADTGTQ